MCSPITLTDGAVSARYIRGINLISQENSSGTQYYAYNGHGDVVQLNNSSGAVLRQYDYDAFGVEKNPDPNDTNLFRYCGEYLDFETNTYYLRARYYDPGIGRFTSEDPIGAGLNYYTYCYNNPVLFIDPSGLIGIMPDGTIHMGEGDTDIDRQLLQLKIDYENAKNDTERKRIAAKAKSIRNNNEGQYRVLLSHSISEYYIRDITTDLVAIMDDLEPEFISHRRDFFWFAKNVNTGAVVDLKNSNDNFKFTDYSYHLIFDGKVYRADASGNILYGYLGIAAGITESELLFGAATQQTIFNIKRGIFRIGDNPGDADQIMAGIGYYFERKNPGYNYPEPMPGPAPR